MKKIYNYFINKEKLFSFQNEIELNIHKNFYKLSYLKKEKIFRKSSENQFGIKKIENEKKGLNWYCSKINLRPNFIIKDYKRFKNYAKIDLSSIKGQKIKSWLPLKKNIRYIKKVSRHYFFHFKFKKKEFIHADLTLDNIIFKKNGIFIIDWELFGSKKNYWGYDIAYLYLSALCLPYICYKKYSNEDEKLFVELWRELLKKGVNRKIITDPFKYFENNIKKNKLIYKTFLISKYKFFPFITPKVYKKRIKNLIKNIHEK